VSSIEEMVLRFQRGDRSYLEKLFQKFEPLIKSLAGKYACRGGSYEDLKQEGYLVLLRLLLNYKKGRVRPEGYIKKSMDMHLRRYWWEEINWRKGVCLAENLSTSLNRNFLNEGNLPLSPCERRLLELYYLWGYNDKHISAKLGKSRSWVNLKRRRLVERLRKLA